MEIWYAFFAACAVMLVSFIGALISIGRIGVWIQKYLTYLATFSGGVFVIIAYHLAEEAVHEGGWVVGIGSVMLGAVLMEAIHYFFPLEHHHHEHEESHAHTLIDGRKVLASDALHNIGDGILLVGAFASDVYVGIAATLGVLLHETVQEISEYFVLRESGLSMMQTLTRNFAVSTTILIGFIFAAFVSWSPLVAILSGLAAGGFMSVVLHDLVPHALASARARGGAYTHVFAALLGAGVMFGLQTFLPHEEEVHMDMDTHAVAAAASPAQIAPARTQVVEPRAPLSVEPPNEIATVTPRELPHFQEEDQPEEETIPEVQTEGTRN
jgi:zinc and cadmium transporter